MASPYLALQLPMRNPAIILSTLALLVSCGPRSESESNTSKKTMDISAMISNTNTSICKDGPKDFGPNAEAKSIEGRWQSVRENSSVRVTGNHVISKDQIQFSNTCLFVEDRTITATVTTSSSYTDNELKILTANASTEILDEDGTQSSCSASVKARTMKYRFKGPCLVLIDTENSTEEILVPIK